MTINYLYRREEQGIQDYLINSKLYKEEITVIDFYLPQLWFSSLITFSHLVVQRPRNNALAKFLRSISERYLSIALKIYWIFSGYENDCKAAKEYNSWVTTMREQIEMRMLNGDKKALANLLTTSIDPSLILNDKIRHFDYATLINEFVEKLIKKAVELKNIVTYSRFGALNKFFIAMNQWIEEKIRGKNIEPNSKYQKYYKGVLIPLEIGENADPLLILNIIPSLGHCYNTRKRAPYKIAFETIRLYEAELWQQKIAKVNVETFREEIKNEAKTEIHKACPFPKKRQTVDDLFSYKLEFKGFETFAKLIKAEEQKIKREIHNKTLPHLPQLSARIKSIEIPKRRVHSAERTNYYIKDRFLSRMSTVKGIDLRNRNDIDLEMVIEKYGRKNSITPKNADPDYIPLEDRLEGVPDPFGESWESIIEKTKEKSIYNKFDTYNVKVYITKGNDDLRQELMAMQFMKRLQEIYLKAGIQIFLRPYDILITSNDSGIMGKPIHKPNRMCSRYNLIRRVEKEDETR